MGIAAALALAAAAPASLPAVDLGALIAFSGPHECEAAPAFERLQQSLFMGSATRDPRLGRVDVPSPLTRAIGKPWLGRRPDATIVVLPLAGQWHDLRLVALILVAPRRGQPPGFVLRFGEARADVLGALNRLGFAIPARGQRREAGEEDGYALTVGLRSIGRQTDFSCSWD